MPRTGLCRGRHPLQLHMQSKQIEVIQASAAPGFGRQKRPPNLNLGRELGPSRSGDSGEYVRSLISSPNTAALVYPEASIFLKIIKII